MRWKISKECTSILGIEFLFTFFLLYLGLWKEYTSAWIGLGVFIVILAGTLYFFRDPDRTVPRKDNLVLSPADGKIVQIDTADGLPFSGEAFKCVTIFLSLWNVHINRIPVDGNVKLLQYSPGRFYPAFKSEASEKNEHMLIGIESRIGIVFLKQIAGIFAKRILCRLEVGQHVMQGDRFGMIKFGSRVELYLPLSVKLCVAEGDRVRGGESVIGEAVLDA